jgi:hypothetical protein
MSTEELRALLARLNGEGEALTDDELNSLDGALLARADELLDGESTPEVITELESIAAAKEASKELAGSRAEAKAEAEAKRAELISRIKASEPAAETEPVEDAPAETPEVVAEQPAETVDEPTTEAVEEPVAVAASTKPKTVNLQAMSAARPRSAAPAPKAEAGLRARATVTAIEGGRNVRRGDEIPSLQALSEIMADRLSRGNTNGDVVIASMKTEYPEERTLRHNDSGEINSAKIEAAFGAQGLVASGGICTPVAVDYTIPVFGATTDRPLRDSLPRFGADRGGIRYVAPATYSTPAGAVGIWTNAVDASPGTATKALYTIACGSEVQVLVDAVTMRMKVGNMQGRFSPEQVAEITTLALSNAARTAELNLLAKINAASTLVSATSSVTGTGAYGATRELLDEIERAAMAMKYRNRANPNQMLHAIFPEFLRGIIRSDIARELAHDNSGSYNALAITDAQIDSWFAIRGINTTFLMDPLPAVTGTGGYPFQGFAAQSTGALNAWPVSASWNLFPEGAFQFLDGGNLDLGVVRDSTLDSTNDYETFVETFEAVAFRSVEALQIVSALSPTGRSGASA